MPLRPHCLVALLVSGPALAADPYDWAAPTAEVQLLDDRTTVPAGQGAVFVPSLTGDPGEPDVLLVQGDRVIRGPIGQRIAAEPGTYVVLVGSGHPDLAAGTRIEVRAGSTTLVPANWGGLKVEMVDRRLRRRAVAYEIVHVATDTVVDRNPELRPIDAPPTDVWLLTPGLYRVQEKGAAGTNRTDWTTVHVPEGGLANLRLFVEPRTGVILGGGVISTDAADAEPFERSPWTGRLVLGLEGSYTQSQHYVGQQDLTLAQGTAFVDFGVDFTSDRHLWDFNGSAAYGLFLLEPSIGDALPLIKVRDELEAATEYTFLLNEGVGLFVRGSGETQMLPTNAVAAEDSVIAVRQLDGNVRFEQVTAPAAYEIAAAWSPLTIKTSTGLRTRLAAWRDFDVSLRGGVGYRVYLYSGALLPDDRKRTPEIEYSEIDDLYALGIEVGASATIRIASFATYTGGVDVFGKVDDLDRFIFEWDNSLDLRITRALSVNYRISLDRNPFVSERIQFRQGLFLRAQLSLL